MSSNMRASRATKLETAGRLSHLSGASFYKADMYTSSKTPIDILETGRGGGAMREGGAPRLMSKDYFGVIAQYATVGFVDSVLPATIYPFMQNYLNCSGSQALTASTLVALPWSFKFFYGLLSDCVPICGYRRRPYMVIGWLVCFAMLVVMACSPVGDPYYSNPSDRDILPKDYSKHPGIEDTFNKSAPSKAAKYVMLMMLSACGYLLADVCADGIVVELAQREPLAVRGTTQTTIYATRTGFNVVGQLVVGFAFNGKDYGGDFDFSLSFPVLMLILAIVCLPIIPVTWFFIKEEKKHRAVFSDYMRELWGVMQTRAVYQVIFYSFFSGIFANFSYTASTSVQSYMVHVTPINNTISSVLGNFVYMVGILITGRYGLHWNWRTMTVFTGISVILVDGACTLITVWDVFRNQWFWLGMPIAVYIPQGISFIISTFVTVELVGDGNEGAMYGLLTTVANLSQPFATTLTKIVDQPFNLSNERIQNDDHSIRMDLTYSIIIMYAMSVVSWGFLVFLPNQKAATQALKRIGGANKTLGALTVLYLIFALVWSVMVNIMGMYDSTSCLVIAGGDGC